MQMNLSAEDARMLWDDVVEMAHDCDDATVVPWLERLTPVSLADGTMTLETRQNWTAKKIMGEYRAIVEELLSEITLEPISLNVVVSGISNSQATAPATQPAATQAAVPQPAVPQIQPAVAQPAAPTAQPAATQAGAPALQPLAPQIADVSRETIDVEANQPSPQQQIPAYAQTNPSQQGPSSAELAAAAAAAAATGSFREKYMIPGVNFSQAAALQGDAQRSAAQSDVVAPQAGYPSHAAPDLGHPSQSVAMPGYSPQPTEMSALSATAPAAHAGSEAPAAAEESVYDAGVPIIEDGQLPKQGEGSGYSEYNFDTYIVGETNNMAFSMARTVAEQPGSLMNLNPLFIWGPSGNGKTHLLFSISNYLVTHHPNLNVQYVPSNAFVEQYIDDIRNKRLRGKEVLKAYRDVDVLLVDDVQFFEDKQESVSTFFDIFNQLILNGKQIVLAADTPPDYLALDDRMRTRFASGATVDIKAPTYEMKRSILMSYYERTKASMNWCNVEIPDKLFDVMAQLAPSNPRNMQGLMTSILLRANDDPSVLSSEGIKSAIKDMFKSTEVVDIPSIIRVVCSSFGVTGEEIRGKSRKKAISEARQVVMWMARQLTDESYENIGAELGGRDHSTVYYSISTIEKRTVEDKSYLYKLERLKKEIVS